MKFNTSNSKVQLELRPRVWVCDTRRSAIYRIHSPHDDVMLVRAIDTPPVQSNAVLAMLAAAGRRDLFAPWIFREKEVIRGVPVLSYVPYFSSCDKRKMAVSSARASGALLRHLTSSAVKVSQD